MSNSFSDKPKVSVITACLNSEKCLEVTIKSVVAQTYPNIEYIVIDGQSVDGTVEIIRKYKDYISCWISEKDRGISDAFNKGFALSKGEWLAYLNAGDAYCNNQAIGNLMEDAKEYDIVYGGIKSFHKNNRHPHYYYPKDVNGDIYWLNNAIPHQTSITSRKVFEKIGMFDDKIKFSMDYDHFLRAYMNGFRFKAIKETITQINNSGVSAAFWKEQLGEFLLIQKKYKILPLLRLFFYCERFLRTYAYQKLGYF